MTTKPNQLKRLYWHMVLATVVLLAFGSTCPKAMDSKTIVAASSASQHALSVSQSDARTKRYLGSKYNTSVTRNIDDSDEERMIDFLGQAAEKEIAETAAHLTAPNNPTATEVLHGNVDNAVNTRLVLYNPGKDKLILDDENLSKDIIKEPDVVKIKLLMTEGHHKEALLDLASCGNVREMLKTQVLADWIKQNRNNNPFRYLFNVVEIYFGDGELEKMLAEAILDAATTEYASILIQLYRDRQSLIDMADNRFKGLGLDRVGNTLFKIKEWKQWLLHVKQLNQDQTFMDVGVVVFSVLRKNKGDKGLEELIETASNKKVADVLQTIWKMMPKNPYNRKNDNKAANTGKRKRLPEIVEAAESVGEN